MEMNEPIAIVGSGCRLAGDIDSPSKLWQLLREPCDLRKEITTDRFSVDGFYHPDGSYHGHSNVRHAYVMNHDPSQFDATFFGIKPSEAKSMDPQQRLLLEVVYESIEAAGMSITGLNGSDTAVYAGLMTNDYGMMLTRDLAHVPTYHATGISSAIVSNRVSYFFNWHGPSMTVDTGCSASLVALHLAVQSLRNGESRMAIACGTNLILGPEYFVIESKLKMLSPDGRSKMWDQAANGYARGDGVTSVVLKTLSAALADGDHIECIIRETGLNQDGSTPGITMPSAAAQEALIRSTYAKAGLNLQNPCDRPQYFEAHGTGTPAGDPIEAEAISKAFFRDPILDNTGHDGAIERHPLYVGSIKTVLGHTEGSAGLAAILKASLALRNSTIPPNYLFNQLSDRVAPFYDNLEIATSAKPWPKIPDQQVRRASVNSFGFGGANAHAILESYHPPLPKANQILHSGSRPTIPFVFSAPSEKALKAVLTSYANYLLSKPDIAIEDLAYTLCERRGPFSFRVSFAAGDLDDLSEKINIHLQQEGGIISTKALALAHPGQHHGILGVFTGQGAQYPRMGAELIEKWPQARRIIKHLEMMLSQLPINDRPSWSLKAELLANAKSSRVQEATISQPLCTAVQIMMVDLLKLAKVDFCAVVGHSSGEIAAAYAAGFLTAREAISIAYYRGLHLSSAESPKGKEIPGAMLAVGLSMSKASIICNRIQFAGRISIAASNSSSSVTISGDEDAIIELQATLDAEKVFNRRLKVDKAYHSAHMEPCGGPYITSLEACVRQRQVQESSNTCLWYSSVYDKAIDPAQGVSCNYWAENMANPVLFSQALTRAVTEMDFEVVIEVGAHPALKGPASQTIGEAAPSGQQVPYLGTLKRGITADEGFSVALGQLWSLLGPPQVNLWESLSSGMRREPLEICVSERRRDIRLIELADFTIHHAVVLPEDDAGVEVLVELVQIPTTGSDCLKARFTYSAAVGHDVEILTLAASATIVIKLGTPATPLLPPSLIASKLQHATRVDVDSFYSALAELGYNFTVPSNLESESLLIHPAELDAAFQAILLACSYPNDEQLRALHLPTAIRLIRVEPAQCSSRDTKSAQLLPVEGAIFSSNDEIGIIGDVNISSPCSSNVMVQMQGIKLVPFGGASAEKDDRKLFSTTQWISHSLDGSSYTPLDQHMHDTMSVMERISAFYLHQIDLQLAQDHPLRSQRPLCFYLSHAHHITSLVDSGSHGLANKEWENDTLDSVMRASEGFSDVPDIRLAHLVGEQMPRALRGETTMIEEFRKANILGDYYTNGAVIQSSATWIVGLMKQLVNHFPQLNILEIGEGVTSRIPSAINNSFLNYTYTNVSGSIQPDGTAFFSQVDDPKPVLTIDLELDPTTQGYVESSYDVIIAFWIMHATKDLNSSLCNLRKLLKPGGYLIVAEGSLTSSGGDGGLTSIFGTLGGWWLGADQGRTLNPYLSTEEWDKSLKCTGFSGVELTAPKQLTDTFGAKLFLSQAVNEQEVDYSTINSRSTVISLTELDEPVFLDITEPRFSALKQMFGHGKKLLWVTSGRVDHQPYSNLTLGFGRTAAIETPGLLLQQLDIYNPLLTEAHQIAEIFLRFVSTIPESTLWNAEPEIIIDERGIEMIPRLKPIPTFNNRHNSSSREIKQLVDTHHSQFSLETTKLGWTARYLTAQCMHMPENLDLVTMYSTSTAIKTSVGQQYLVLCRHEVSQKTYGLSNAASIVSALRRAINKINSYDPAHLELARSLDFSVDIGSLLERPLTGNPLEIIDWTKSSTIPITVGRADNQQTFRSDKTYWIIGLSTALGASLFDWMIQQGAKNLVFSRRRPDLDVEWVEAHKRNGVRIEVVACDLTDEMSLKRAHAEICATLPPIAGVMNGAAVFRDNSILNMSFNELEDSLAPKVLGTIHLDRIFYHENLDFFILTSSITGLLGSEGQANYAAANTFMCGLAAQRRKRGLAATAINLGAIAGVGLLERSDKKVLESIMQRLSLMPVSEGDFHQIFAEAIEAGRPNSSTCGPELTTALRAVPFDDSNAPAFFSNPIFSHFRQVGLGQKTKGSKGASTKELLAMCETEVDLQNIIKGAFSNELRKVLHTTMSDDELMEMRSIDLGIDSLVSIDLRTWFTKNLKVNIPVLKIMGNDPTGDLVSFAINHIPSELVPMMPNRDGLGEITKEDASKMTIDWDVETAPPADLSGLTAIPVVSTGNGAAPNTIVLTGASGFLGHHILQALLEQPSITKVHCIAMRRLQEKLKKGDLPQDERVVYYEGELHQPRLGLSEAAAASIFGEVDAVIHNGADTSHLKSYFDLKPSNIDSTLELIRLCLPRRVPLHFVSSNAVGRYSNKEQIGEVPIYSPGAPQPPTDGSSGYRSTKWAAETLLERVHEATRLPIWIHRPSTIIRSGRDAEGQAAQLDWMNALIWYMDKLSAVPKLNHGTGFLDLVHARTVRAGIVSHVMKGEATGRTEKVGYVHHMADLLLPLARLEEFSQESGRQFRQLRREEWTAEAVAAGMHPAVVVLIEMMDAPDLKGPPMFVKGPGSPSEPLPTGN
ncbi:hypothetical protein F5B22DRAFT_639320 [Xylaria bambusicola]|uniref:uncharacterized protein n=1 Tax=Xylaria bambusicola TaxID=326684 RepID=UPI002007EC80|nr:uncharacterized protein F5B22DRAFT_639320 [Xylaria bambusicola]KAI0506314.1 hypothetical protein F5B22DRAFT_639320 [Xylaria bambusicola]